jgi:signal recognition particle subunit SRP54
MLYPAAGEELHQPDDQGRGALSEADVSAALREVRRALLEADVALDVVRSFTDKVREKAVGAES